MAEIQDKTRDQLMRVVNDIIYMAHRILVPEEARQNYFCGPDIEIGRAETVL